MQLEPADASCMLWKNGIRWLDGDEIKTIVDGVMVVVVMRCRKGSEISCVKLHSSVIQQVLNVKNRVCSEVKPEHYAALGGSLNVLKHPIAEKRCNPMCTGQYCRTPLRYATEKGHVKCLIDEHQVNHSCPDDDKDTPLHCATLSLNVKHLITEKRCNKMCRGQYRTPLHHASEKGHLDVVKYLIDEYQVDPSCQYYIRRSPTDLALNNDLVLYLISRGGSDNQLPDCVCPFIKVAICSWPFRF